MARMSSSARVQTGSARRYMVQLCRHFAHKLPASFDDDSGSLEFPFGVCAMKAGPRILQLTVEAAGGEDLGRMEQVVARHLERFAFREPLDIAWVRGGCGRRRDGC
jgi:hypothetical protein